MPANKRKRSAKQDKTSKKAKQDGKKPVSHNIHVPVDEGFAKPVNVKVYIDEEGLVYDASLNQTNIGENNNKYYRLQILAIQGKHQYFTHTRWGRVGENGQAKTMGPTTLDAALTEFDKKFKSKTGHKWEDRVDAQKHKEGKYTFIERNYNDDEEATMHSDSPSDKPHIDSKLPIQTQRLIELIFNQNHFNAVLEHIGYNAEKLPLGKLGETTLKQGFEYLQELAGLIKHPALARNKYNVEQEEAIEDFSNKYYSTIPHEFGRSRPPSINTNDRLRQEVSMLDTLTDMSVAETIMKSTGDKATDSDSVNLLDRRFQDLGMDEMTPLDHDSDEYRALSDYLVKSSGSHNIRYRLEDIFRIERRGETSRFSSSKFAKLHKSDRRLLWHGSRTTNFGGILSQGLRIAPPEAPVNGYAFGKGIYLADVSSKSAQYCSPGMSGGTGILLLCEAELGNPKYEIPTGDSQAKEEAMKRKCVSTLGVGRSAPQGWVDGEFVHDSLKGVSLPDSSKGIGDNKAATAKGYLLYNEYICYDVAQLRMRYLFRVGM